LKTRYRDIDNSLNNYKNDNNLNHQLTIVRQFNQCVKKLMIYKGIYLLTQ